MDRPLDSPKTGPIFLSQPETARMVVHSLVDGETRFHRDELHALVIMPNHAHILVTSRVPSSEWLRSLKGFTGHEALRILNQSGKRLTNASSHK